MMTKIAIVFVYALGAIALMAQALSPVPVSPQTVTVTLSADEVAAVQALLATGRPLRPMPQHPNDPQPTTIPAYVQALVDRTLDAPVQQTKARAGAERMKALTSQQCKAIATAAGLSDPSLLPFKCGGGL